MQKMHILFSGTIALVLLTLSTGVSAYFNNQLLLAQVDMSTGLEMDMTECLDTSNLYWDQQTSLCYVEKPPCIDPDGGRNYEDRAHTFGWHSWHTNDRERRIRVGGLDACIDDMLREHFCANTGDITTEDIHCPYGCSEGTCLPSGSGGNEPVINHVWVTQKPYCQSSSWVDSPQNAICNYDFWIWVDAYGGSSPEVRILPIADPRIEYGAGNMIAKYWYGNDHSKTFYALQVGGYTDNMLPLTETYRIDVTSNGKTVRKFVEITLSKDIPQTENVTPPGSSQIQSPRQNSKSSSDSSVTDQVGDQCPDIPREKLSNGCHYVMKTRGECIVANIYCKDGTGGSNELSSRTSIPPAGYEDDVLTSFDAYENPFPDTIISSLEGKAAAELYRRAVIGGFSDGEFKGHRLVNRAEAAKFLLLARFGEIADSANSDHFPDVLDGQWYVRFVVNAALWGIINGYPDGTFRPADSVNTAEFLKMLARTFDLDHNLSHTYSDVSADEWFSEYAGIAEKYSLFPDRTEQLFPEKKLTRNEVAVAIYQFLSNR